MCLPFDIAQDERMLLLFKNRRLLNSQERKYRGKLMFGDTMIKGIDHVAIVVSDMDRSIKFYSEVLGLKIHYDGRKDGGKKKSFLGTKSTTLVALTEDENRGKDGGLVEGV